jgi:hypothetical protein
VAFYKQLESVAHNTGHSFTSPVHYREGDYVMAHLLRSRCYDISLVLLGVVALVTKRHINVGIVQSYGGNIAASFSTFFLLKPPFGPSKFQTVAAAALALLATELFEASNGFGFMSNTYDPADYVANALGVALAASVNTALQLASRPRKGPNDSPSVSE